MEPIEPLFSVKQLPYRRCLARGWAVPELPLQLHHSHIPAWQHCRPHHASQWCPVPAWAIPLSRESAQCVGRVCSAVPLLAEGGDMANTSLWLQIPREHHPESCHGTTRLFLFCWFRGFVKVDFSQCQFNVKCQAREIFFCESQIWL